MALSAAFFGTPEFAVPSLARLLDRGDHIPLVVTQPDRPAGRHALPRSSAVARVASARALTVEKPDTLRGNSQFLERLVQARPDVGVVVAYGRILPPEILSVPRLGFVNVHASLLPKYRGASPVQAAIFAGDARTGVVTMRVVDQLDAGPVFLSRAVDIGGDEDSASLSARLAVLGAELLDETLAGLEARTLSPKPQEGHPSFCKPIRREDGRIDWSRPAAEIARRLRALSPWPGLYSFLGKERIKILGLQIGPLADRPAGSLWLEGENLFAAAGERTSVLVTRLQRAGGRPASGEQFARGLRVLPARFS